MIDCVVAGDPAYGNTHEVGEAESRAVRNYSVVSILFAFLATWRLRLQRGSPE